MPLGSAGWALVHLEFGVSINPIPTRGADYAHRITACPSGFENLAASLRHVCDSKNFGAKLLLLKCFESATK